jgi:hypothetical protein
MAQEQACPTLAVAVHLCVQGLSSYQSTPFGGYHRQKWAGLQQFRAAYNKALILEQKTNSGLSTLLEKSRHESRL